MASQASWYLTVQKGPNSGRVYPLTEATMTIGRHANNHITIDDARISRHHVRLTRRGNAMQVEDMGSANGAFVNNMRLTGPVQLREGDTIGLSQDIILRFERQPSADDATVLVASRPVAMTAVSPPPVAAPAKGNSNWLTIAITGIMGLIILVLLVIAAGLFLFRNNSAAVSLANETPTPPPSPMPTSSPTVAPTYTPYPTYTLVPTEMPTATPYPTYTPVPTEVPTVTPYPTYTPVPTEVPTATPYPTYTPVPAKIVVVEATPPPPTAVPIILPTATPPFVLSLGRNVGYEPWGKPGDPDGCGPPYDDRIEVRRFTAEVILTNNSKQFIGEDWWPTMLSASGAPVPSCWFYYNNVVVEPGETTDVTYSAYLAKGDYVKAMVFPILGQTAVICMGPNGQEVPCP